MKQILQTLVDHFVFLFERFEFKLRDSLVAENLGNALVILENRELRIRFVRDKAQIFIELASSLEPDVWYDLGIIKDIIKNEELNTSLVSFELAQFFKDNYLEIEAFFSPRYLTETKRRILQAKEDRAKKMFG